MAPGTYPPPHLLDSARWKGRRIGLLGGSFNPPHEGHLHVSLTALRMLKLDFIWWLVTPQNPFKTEMNIPPLEERVALCESFATHPQIIVSGIEAQTGTTRSVETLTLIKKHFPHTAFAWITGMDIAHEFHEWYRWRYILELAATAHVARPPAEELVRDCPLRLTRRQNHRVLEKPENVSLAPRRSYWILDAKLLDISSTYIRNNISNQ